MNVCVHTGAQYSDIKTMCKELGEQMLVYYYKVVGWPGGGFGRVER